MGIGYSAEKSKGARDMLDQTALTLLRESRCSGTTNGIVTISYVLEVKPLSRDAKIMMSMKSFVGNICRACRNRLWLLVLEEVRYAKH